jgi:hypothetical protein
MPHYTFRELDPKYLEPIKDLVADVVYPEKRYLGYRISPIILLKDGRNVPLLQYLARLKFGSTYDMRKQEALWADTNWYNATPENITILDREVKTGKRAGRPSKLNLGVPYGHPEYQRRYLEATREHQREYRRKRYVRKRYEAIEAADQAAGTIPVIPEETQGPSEAADMANRLDDILLSTKITTTKELPTPSARPPVRWSSIQESNIPSQFSQEYLDGISAAPAPDDVFARSKKG